MKICVIGHLCYDHFHRSDGTVERVIGGIYHAVAALAALASDRDKIVPVFGVGENDFEEVRDRLSRFTNVDTSGLYAFPGTTNIVRYFDDSPNECSDHIAPPIPFRHLRPFLNSDGIYINMISGSDITIDTLDEIRLDIRGKKIPLHLDIHCLTLHRQEDGTRTFKPMEEWRRWCFMTDCVQMNEQEAAEISLEHFPDELLAKQMLHLMVKAFVVTRGEKGATLFQGEHKTLTSESIGEGGNPAPVSTIGSGDIFGAAMLLAYLKKKNYTDAARFAHRAASLSTGYSVSEKHAVLRGLRESL